VVRCIGTCAETSFRLSVEWSLPCIAAGKRDDDINILKSSGFSTYHQA